MTAADHLPIVETRTWRNEDDTAAFAAALAAAMRARAELANVFISLHGDLGAGKTTFVRHLLRALGVAGRIKSPTYAVVEPHAGRLGDGVQDELAISHFDFYRFSDPREVDDAGFRDIFAAPGLKLAEWPENAADRIPIADLAIKIEAMNSDIRKVTLHAHTAPGQRLLEAAHA